ncbi:hypothetical protein EB796_011313 [Bugula neritina]|uniref:Uncharacterized protein n=1 Tax=Bugula neritina TaxID=10212 RepID=A0A7J7JYC8_BUGNE|nr:hypothetical protein EB796_011313 [Bugula neritina]
MGNWNNYSYGQQWDGSQQQQWSQQQQYGSQWGGGDASNWQQGYQQQGYQQQGYPQQGNYNYSNGGGY